MHEPHDTLFKAVFGNPAHAAAELRAVLPSELARYIDFDSLVKLPHSFVDARYKWRHSDLIFSARIAERDALIYCLFEHQSDVDKRMPLRLLRYMVRIWDAHLEIDKTAKRLPMIVPVVLHHGKSGWTAATQFQQLLDVPATEPALSRYVPNFEFVLDDLVRASDAELQSRQMAAFLQLVLWVMRDARRRGRLLSGLRAWRTQLRAVARTPGGWEALELIFMYIAQVAGEHEAEQFFEQAQAIDSAVKEHIMTYAQKLEARGIKLGIKKGEALGIKKGEALGVLQGQRAAVIGVLEARGVVLSPEQRQRIEACESAEQLDRWVRLAATIGSADELFV